MKYRFNILCVIAFFSIIVVFTSCDTVHHSYSYNVDMTIGSVKKIKDSTTYKFINTYKFISTKKSLTELKLLHMQSSTLNITESTGKMSETGFKEELKTTTCRLLSFSINKQYYFDSFSINNNITSDSRIVNDFKGFASVFGPIDKVNNQGDNIPLIDTLINNQHYFYSRQVAKTIENKDSVTAYFYFFNAENGLNTPFGKKDGNDFKIQNKILCGFEIFSFYNDQYIRQLMTNIKPLNKEQEKIITRMEKLAK